MARYRKKPVVIEAVRVADVLDAESPAELPVWVEEAKIRDVLQVIRTTRTIHIRTPEGVMRGDWSDWLIRGVHGELYPCRSDVFEATYDEVIG